MDLFLEYEIFDMRPMQLSALPERRIARKSRRLSLTVRSIAVCSGPGSNTKLLSIGCFDRISMSRVTVARFDGEVPLMDKWARMEVSNIDDVQSTSHFETMIQKRRGNWPVVKSAGNARLCSFSGRLVLIQSDSI